MRFCSAAADASAELVELGKAETLGMFDNHYGGVGDVDADFYDGGCDQNLQFVFAEALHDIVFFFAGEASMQEADLHFRKNFFGKALVLFDGCFQLDFRFFNYRIHDVGLMAGFDFATNAVPDAGKMRFGSEVRFDGGAARR